jgi:SP family sugar porter-like MFS transporter
MARAKTCNHCVAVCLPYEFFGDKNLFSLFSSLLNLGAMFGAVSGGVVADKLGRRGAFLVACTISILGSCCIIFGYALWILNAGRSLPVALSETRACSRHCRFINGFGMGLFSLLVPMYISEISPTSLRGALGTCNQLGISSGLVIAFAIGIPTADDLEKREWWRYVAAISASPVIVLFLGFLLYVPETPRWLVGQGRAADALDALQRLRGSDAAADLELKQLQLAQEESSRQSGSTGPANLGQQLKVMFSPKYVRPLSIAVGLQVVQQFTGINGVFFFLGSLFSSGKVDVSCDRDDIRQAILYSTMGASLQVVANLICLYFTNKTGRRVLLTTSLLGMCVCLAIGGCASFFNWPFAISAAAVCCYIFSFAIGCGPVPWLMMSEVMPSRIRGPAMSLGTLSNWLGCVYHRLLQRNLTATHSFDAWLSFAELTLSCKLPLSLPTLATPPLTKVPSPSFGYLPSCTLLCFLPIDASPTAPQSCRRCVLAILWVNAAVPETKDRTLEEIEALLVKGYEAPTSVASSSLLRNDGLSARA